MQVMLKTNNIIKIIELKQGLMYRDKSDFNNNKACILFESFILLENTDKDKVKRLYDKLAEKIFYCNENNINCNIDLEAMIKEVEANND